MDSIISQSFLKFLLYLTAHHPEEFGLIPDKDDFLKVKEIFQVLIFTKKAHNLNLDTLKNLFSYHFRDFFEFSDNLSLVRPKERFYSPPQIVDFNFIVRLKQLWTFVKPWLWYKLSIEEMLSFRNSLPLFREKELAENWAKIKGALLIEVIPKFLDPEGKYQILGHNIVLSETLPFKACKGPNIDQKFIQKYLKKKETQPKKELPLMPLQDKELTTLQEELPFRKLTHGKKKEKPWKAWQKKRQKEKEK